MPHRHGLHTTLLAGVACCSLFGCSKDKLSGPQAEVHKSEVKVTLPAVPDFALPTNSDGSHSVKEMRVKGKKLLDTEVTVKGYVTWVYDCLTAVRQPDQSEEDAKKAINNDPQLCERQKFYIGDKPDTPAEKSLWVVEVPRPFFEIELKRLPKEELKNPPPDKCDDKKKKNCPVYKLGDEVLITGDFKLNSPHSERNSEGLIVYKSMKNVTQGWESPPPDPNAPKPGEGEKLSPEDIVKQKKPG